MRLAVNLATSTPRAEAILRLEDACRACGVSILDFRFFSDLSLALQVESNAAQCLALMRRLESDAFRLSAASRSELGALAQAAADTELQGTLQVSFAGGEGGLEIAVPMVPG